METEATMLSGKLMTNAAGRSVCRTEAASSQDNETGVESDRRRSCHPRNFATALRSKGCSREICDYEEGADYTGMEVGW